MGADDEKTQLISSASAWVLSTADTSIGDMVVTPDKVVTIGRQTGCDIVILNNCISRRHAEVYLRDGRLFVKDLQSTHGTQVNGQAVSECALQPGDEIRLDKAVFTVQQLSAVVQPSPDQPPNSGGATVVRKLDDVAPSLDAAAAPPAQPAAAAAEPQAVKSKAAAAAEPPVAKPEAAVAVEPPAQRAADAGPVQAAAPGEAGAPAGGDEPRRSKNWWDPQEAGPMGTRLVHVQDVAEEMHRSLAPQMETDRPMLLGISQGFEGQQFELKPGKMIVGKKADADICLNDEYVSDVHAQIIGEGVSWRVVNVLSANGTFVNGKKVQSAYLRSGDVLRFGRIDLQFVDSGGRKRKAGAGAQAAAGRKRTLFYAALGFVAALAVLALVFAVLRLV